MKKIEMIMEKYLGEGVLDWIGNKAVTAQLKNKSASELKSLIANSEEKVKKLRHIIQDTGRPEHKNDKEAADINKKARTDLRALEFAIPIMKRELANKMK